MSYLKFITIMILLLSANKSLANSISFRFAPESNFTELDNTKANQFGITYSWENSKDENYLFSYMYASEVSDSDYSITRHDFQYLQRELVESYYVISGYRFLMFEDWYQKHKASSLFKQSKETVYALLYEYGYGKYWSLGDGHGFIGNATVGLGFGHEEDDSDDDTGWQVGLAVDLSGGYSYSYDSGSLYARYRYSGVPGGIATHGPELGVTFVF